LTPIGHQGAVTCVAFSPDGSRLASGGGSRNSGELFVWEVQSGQRVHALSGHPAVVTALSWAAGGEVVVSDGRLRWWDVHSGACMREREAHQGAVQALKVSLDGSKLASCGDDGAIRVWDLHSGEQLRTLRRDRPYERLNITGIRGLTEAQKVTLHALGAVEDGVL
jgi:WD40 repeat protein